MRLTHIKILLVFNLLLSACLFILHFTNTTIPLDLSDQVIKARGLIITDSAGVERVVIGSPVPPPQLHGYRFSRGEHSVSGIILYDFEGQERSGYVTDDHYGNVFFTLDSKTSQQALFIAEPQGAASLMMWSDNGNRVDINTSDESVSLKISERGRHYQFPDDEQ